MGNLSRYLQLPFTKQRLLVESTLLLLAVRIGLRILPFKTIHRFIQHGERRPIEIVHDNDAYQNEITWAIQRTGDIRIGEHSCLPLALAGQLQLNLHGFPASTRFGVQKTMSGELKAHAWIECNGKVVFGGMDHEIEHYSVLSDIEGI